MPRAGERFLAGFEDDLVAQEHDPVRHQRAQELDHPRVIGQLAEGCALDGGPHVDREVPAAMLAQHPPRFLLERVAFRAREQALDHHVTIGGILRGKGGFGCLHPVGLLYIPFISPPATVFILFWVALAGLKWLGGGCSSRG